MGKTAGKVSRLLHRVNFIGQINQLKFKKQIEINRGVEEVLIDILARLTIAEEVQEVLLDDIKELKRSNFDYKISLLSKGLDDAHKTINKLENTAWRRFCRWIGRK